MPGPVADAYTDADADADDHTYADTDADADAYADTDADADAYTDADADAYTDTDADAYTEPEPEPDAWLRNVVVHRHESWACGGQQPGDAEGHCVHGDRS